MHEGFAIIFNPMILVYVEDDPMFLEDEGEFFQIYFHLHMYSASIWLWKIIINENM